jgi:hypothetical protein
MSFRSYDTHPGTLGSLVPGKSGRGVSRPVYQYDYEQDQNDEDENLIDDYVDDLLDDKVDNKLHKMIGSEYSGGVDTYPNKGSRQYNVGGNYLHEFSGDHRNTARKGISPFKQPKHSGAPIGSGGSNQAFRTTGNFIGIGTQYGTSRPHKLLTDIEDDPIESLDQMLDPMERSFLRRNNRVRKFLNLLKEYLNE